MRATIIMYIHFLVLHTWIFSQKCIKVLDSCAKDKKLEAKKICNWTSTSLTIANFLSL